MPAVALEILGVGVILSVIISGLYYLLVIRPDMRRREAEEAARRDLRQENEKASQKGKRR